MMLKPKIEDLLSKVDSKYTLVIASAKRARQINDYLNSIRRHELTGIRAPEIEALSNKPLSIALEEIAETRITYERLKEGVK